ncbi:MAG TPA: M56 family metallopeptidase [Candidatus Elarobacter sp.]|jgi:beta-lactamase regulating signal transducer with metallopeptidase domain
MNDAILHALAPYRGLALGLVFYLISSLVMGAVLAGIAALVVRFWRPLDAAARYAVWYVTLIAVVLGPLAALGIASYAQQGPHTVRFATHAGDARAVHSASAPVVVRLPRPTLAVAPLVAYAVAGAWLLIVLAGSARFIAGALVLARLKRDALPLAPDRRAALPLWRAHAGAEHARRARLCVSDRVEVPAAVGLFDGMVVLPQHVLDEFEPSDVDRFVLHELAHLERRDDWTAVVQRLVQLVLFFNPAVHAIARRLDLEREIACDDRVVAATSDVRSYAVGLTRMAESTAWPHRGIAAPAIFVTRRQLSLRVEQLLRGPRGGVRHTAVVPALIALVASLGVVAVAAPLTPSVGLSAAASAADDTSRVVEARLMLVDKNGKPVFQKGDQQLPLHGPAPGVIVVRSEYKTISAYEKAHGPIDAAHIHALLKKLEQDPRTKASDRRVIETITHTTQQP